MPSSLGLLLGTFASYLRRPDKRSGLAAAAAVSLASVAIDGRERKTRPFQMHDHLPPCLPCPAVQCGLSAGQRLQEELKEIALKRCDDSVAKFAACAREKGMLVVFSCREQSKLSE